MKEKAELAILIAPVKDRMFATVWRILRHPQDTEDALQNALVTVWRRQTQVEAHPAPHALILRICADAAIDQFRRRRVGNVEIDQLKDRIQSADLSPLDGMIKQENIDILMTGISQLSGKQSVAIVMKYIMAESHANIAQALGCTTETVREHITRGRERLSQMLGQLVPFSLENEG